MPRQSRFRLQGKSIFLTYPKCPLIPMFMLDYLYNLFSSFNPTYARICQEDHEDGSPHLHCLIQTDKKFCITNERHFDVSDPNRSGIYHPNCQIPRRDADVADYIAKGGRFEERGILRASRRSPKKSRDSLWTAILNESTSKSEFLARCVHDQPYTAVTQYRNLEYFANTKWPEPITVYEPKWTTFPHVPEPIKQWAEDNLFVDQELKPDRSVTLIIEGPTRTGKTAWARSLGLHNYFCGGVDWSNYNNLALYNVFDDIPFQFLPCKKEILGCQKDFTVNEKYRKKCRIKGGIPSIILCNPDQSYSASLLGSDMYTWSIPNVKHCVINEAFY
ncbi:Replication-associated protein [Thalictrum thalictroides]|uniref:Replication-associated protein n=1 Tax=Thalictrum thalictroides TaxID=46969 RepID=A0A7J6XCZ0_THATH|nr:Replication-associated protein [Thalictrum thalictroides]